MPAQHHRQERAGCDDRAAEILSADQECQLDVTVGPIPTDEGELRTEIVGGIKVFQSLAEVPVQSNPSPIVLIECNAESLHQLDERRDSLVGEAVVACSNAPQRPLFRVEWW